MPRKKMSADERKQQKLAKLMAIPELRQLTDTIKRAYSKTMPPYLAQDERNAIPEGHHSGHRLKTRQIERQRVFQNGIRADN